MFQPSNMNANSLSIGALANSPLNQFVGNMHGTSGHSLVEQEGQEGGRIRPRDILNYGRTAVKRGNRFAQKHKVLSRGLDTAAEIVGLASGAAGAPGGDGKTSARAEGILDALDIAEREARQRGYGKRKAKKTYRMSTPLVMEGGKGRFRTAPKNKKGILQGTVQNSTQWRKNNERREKLEKIGRDAMNDALFGGKTVRPKF